MAETGFAALRRQGYAFVGVGLVAAVVHYGILIALVQTDAAGPVPAALAGYTAGGVVSYGLNRRHTYRSTRPHREATWRFAAVAFAGFMITWLLMQVLNGRLGVPYIAAQVATTGVVMGWSFLAHKLFTFPGDLPP